MPPKKSHRNSMPARLSSMNGTALSPSRRSLRVPATGQSINQTPRSSKTLDLSSSTRRRTFESRPSRLSTVYTPSSDHSTHLTPRISALETPHSHLADDEFPGGVGSTGWTYDQYTGGLDHDQAMARATSPASGSSAATRRSVRERKLTARAIESQQQMQQPRGKATKAAKKKAASADTAPVEAPAPAKNAPVKKAPKKAAPAKPAQTKPAQTKPAPAKPSATKKAPVKAAPNKKAPAKAAPTRKIPSKSSATKKVLTKPAPAKAPAPVPAPAPAPVSAPVSAPASPPVIYQTNRAKKRARERELAENAKRVDNKWKAIGSLYRLAKHALGPTFELPSDPEKVIADARRSYESGLAGGTQNDPRTANDAPNDALNEKEASGINKYKQSSPLRLDSDGWVLVGRVNESGEEVVLTPSDNSPDRSAHTYGDEGLPHPPVRARSTQDVEKDNALGFPPLLGDRNIPFSAEAQFQPEDVTEEQAQVKARGKARQKKDSGSAGPTKAGKKPRARKQREAKAAPKVEISAAASTLENGETKPTRSRRGVRATKAAAINTESEADKPKIRIRLTLKPAASAEEPAPPAPALAAPPKGKATKSSVSGIKKRALDLTSEVEPANKAPSKRARVAPRN